LPPISSRYTPWRITVLEEPFLLVVLLVEGKERGDGGRALGEEKEIEDMGGRWKPKSSIFARGDIDASWFNSVVEGDDNVVVSSSMGVSS